MTMLHRMAEFIRDIRDVGLIDSNDIVGLSVSSEERKVYILTINRNAINVCKYNQFNYYQIYNLMHIEFDENDFVSENHDCENCALLFEVSIEE